MWILDSVFLLRFSFRFTIFNFRSFSIRFSCRTELGFLAHHVLNDSKGAPRERYALSLCEVQVRLQNECQIESAKALPMSNLYTGQATTPAPMTAPLGGLTDAQKEQMEQAQNTVVSLAVGGLLPGTVIHKQVIKSSMPGMPDQVVTVVQPPR